MSSWRRDETLKQYREEIKAMIDLETTSPLVARVEALEKLQRVEQYLFQTTYASDGHGARSWSQWYADVQDAVDILRRKETTLRLDALYRLGGVAREGIQARIDTLLKMAVGLDEADLELIWTYFPNLLPETKRECLGEVKYVMEDPEEQQEPDEE